MKVRIQGATGSPRIERRGRWIPIARRWPRWATGATITGPGIPADTTILFRSGPAAQMSQDLTLLSPEFLEQIAQLADVSGMSRDEAMARVMDTAAAYPAILNATVHR